MADNNDQAGSGIDGKGLFKQGRYGEAIALLQESLGADPNDITTRVFLAASYAKTGRNEEAIAEFTKLTELDPNNPQHFANLGVAYETVGNGEKAKELFEKALALNPDYQMARQRLDALRPPAPAPATPTNTEVGGVSEAPSPVTAAGPIVPPPAPLQDTAPDPVSAGPVDAGGPITPPPGLNWGAFLLPFWWSIFHSAWLWVVLSIVICPVAAIVLLITGNRVACENRKFRSLEEFRAVEKAWTLWGLIILGINVVLGLLLGGTIVALIAGLMSSGGPKGM